MNGALRYARGDALDYFTVTAMAYRGQWNSTDQVPERAIDEGVISRYGSLNPTDGGESSRASLTVSRVLRTDTDQVQLSAYVLHYKLDLWSTFTYFLKDPVYGDQMLQHDDRTVYGFKASKTWFSTLAAVPMTNVIGVQARVDDIGDVGISPSFERQTIGTTQDAGVVEGSGAVYAENTLQWRDHLRSVIGLREDHFDFDVTDKMRNADGSCTLASDPLGCDSGHRHASVFSPKLGIVLGPWMNTTFFVNIGDGYHSNDARGVTRSGQNPGQTAVTPLTRARSGELGLSAKPLPNWETTLDVFKLKLKSELVFSGDAGVTEPNGSTTRTGVEWGNVYHVNSWLAADLNATFARARFDSQAEPDNLGCGDAAPSRPCAGPIGIVGRYVPNSPTNVIDAGLTAKRASGWFGTVRARHFGESPLVEDNSAKSPAYTTLDAQIGFRSVDHWLAALDIFNVADVRWNDVTYYYVSRLRNEAIPQADYVVHPGVPRTCVRDSSTNFERAADSGRPGRDGS